MFDCQYSVDLAEKRNCIPVWGWGELTNGNYILQENEETPGHYVFQLSLTKYIMFPTSNHRDCFRVLEPQIFEVGHASKGRLAPCPTGLFGPGITRLSQNEFCLTGGNKDLICWTFNLLTNKWKERGNLPKGH